MKSNQLSIAEFISLLTSIKLWPASFNMNVLILPLVFCFLNQASISFAGRSPYSSFSENTIKSGVFTDNSSSGFTSG